MEIGGRGGGSKLNLGSLDLPFYIHSLGTETHPMLLPLPNAACQLLQGKDVLSSAAVITCAEYLLEVVSSCVDLFPECGWMARWQKLAKRCACPYMYVCPPLPASVLFVSVE